MRKDGTLSPKQSLQSIVALEATVPPDAFTASVLGTERAGSGVVIRDDLVLTIGYLIAEAENVTLKTPDGRAVPGHVTAYDQVTGFGLVQPLGKLGLPALKLGDSARAKSGDPVMVAGGVEGVVEARIVAKQEFAGYWEYLLDEAIFTAPAHPIWGGAGLIGVDGALLGIGSLRLQMASGDGVQDINMFVPISLLPPVMDDLLKFGRVNQDPRPWLGVYAADSDGRVVTMNVDRRGPAAKAGLQQGDVIADVRDSAVDDLAGLYRAIWGCGPAGVEIPLRIVRNKRDMWLRIKSADRNSFLKKPVLQ